MADVVLSTVDLDVFGGPESINLSIDVGATGERGSRIWSGPNGYASDLIGQDIHLYDLYINTTSGVMYQYLLNIGSPSWTIAGNIRAQQYSGTLSLAFDLSGTTYISLPINIGDTVNDYVTMINIQNTGVPVSFTVDKAILGSDIYFVITAVQFSGGSWSPITSTKNVDYYIQYVGAA